MRVAVVGSGGREHALAEALASTADVVVTPGNPGIPWSTAAPAEELDVDLYVIGPEVPLVAGLADRLRAAGSLVFGPGADGARLEGSKAWMKEVLTGAGVPTAAHRSFRGAQGRDAIEFLKSLPGPYVVKADGLAAGKGVVVCSTTEDALAAIDRIMVREEFGRAAGRQVVIEKRLEGQELSVLALVAGRTIVPLQPTQDHKAAFDGDTGPNTGGMGAYCPAPLATPALLQDIDTGILVPTVHALKRGRRPFRGVLYAGLMVTNQGPRVLEFNCRFGDPETQPLLMRLKTDLLDLLEAVVDDRLGELEETRLEWDPRPAVCVGMASQGYPGSYAKGKVVAGLSEAAKLPGVKVFHAGTKLENGLVVTDGGRVLSVTALGETLADARRNAYEAVSRIHFQGAFYRRDIADRALAPVTAP
ncbi:MAG TPA: phosphoribosylamine--glycine ligase [Acidimicrobiales bacterium]|nr:phosphoribosylamine--glycine ligase [Acidimicrobiales bacterium]